MATPRDGQLRRNNGAGFNYVIDVHGRFGPGLLGRGHPDAKRRSPAARITLIFAGGIAGRRLGGCAPLRIEARAGVVTNHRQLGRVAIVELLCSDRNLDCDHDRPMVRVHGINISSADGGHSPNSHRV